MEVEVEVSGSKPSAGAKLKRADSQNLRVKRKTLQTVLEQCQRALESLDSAGDDDDDGDEDDDDDGSSHGGAADEERQKGRGSTDSRGDCEANELCDLLKSRVECPDFLQKLECAQASVPQNTAEEGNSWDLVNENDLWDDEDSNSGEEDYVLVRQEDIVEGIACFMAAYLLSLKQTKDLTPNQLQDALSKTFSVKKKKGKLRKAWDGSKVIYNVASWGATAIGLSTVPEPLRMMMFCRGTGDSYLVAGTDGVGTKLKLAFDTGIHDTIGVDLVAMSVNDIVTSGAKPLFFLDYFATSRLDVDLAEKVVRGIVDGCQQSDCTLLGGETAEMPDFYKDGEYDLSGFAVGIVEKDAVIDGKNIEVGDVIIGLPSSGVHSNGFSLVRRVLTHSGLSLKDQLPGKDITLGEALMALTVIYVKQVLDIISKGGVKGIAHITGGGFTDNIPRVFPKGLGAVISKGSWEVPAVFKWIQEAGKIEEAEMMRTFNMGIGMVLIVSKAASYRILENGAYKSYRIGEVVRGEGVSYS